MSSAFQTFLLARKMLFDISLQKLVDSHRLKNVLLEFFSLQWCLLFFICDRTWSTSIQKILVPRPSQATHIKCKHWMCGKTKAIVFVLVIILLKHWCRYFIVLMLMCFQLIMLHGNCLMYSYSLLRTAPAVSQYRKNTRATTFWQLLLVLYTCILAD